MGMCTIYFSDSCQLEREREGNRASTKEGNRASKREREGNRASTKEGNRASTKEGTRARDGPKSHGSTHA